MAFSYGFYNSIEHDRKYNALHMSKIFDGIINDGVYATIGEAFIVKQSPDPNAENLVIVGKGRAWFDHTWNYNDADMALYLPRTEIALDRIDAVVLDINLHDDYRENKIIVMPGFPSRTPERPALIKEKYRVQYPLAYIYRRENNDKIRQADITNMVGTSQCPFVTGIIETINTDLLLLQWQDAWARFVEEYEENAENWFDRQQEFFIEWFDRLQVMLEPDVAANLAKEILKLRIFKSDKVLLARNWQGTEIPFVYDLTFDWIGNNNIIDLISPPVMTEEQVRVYQEAEIVNGAQNKGHLILYAWGVKPSIDLPVTILVKGLSTGTPPTDFDGGSNTDPGIRVVAQAVDYAISSNRTNPPTSGWSMTIPDITYGNVLWTRSTVHYSDGTQTVSYSASLSCRETVAVSGTIVEYTVSTSSTIPPDTVRWSTTFPAIEPGKYVWTRTTVTYTNGNSTTTYSGAYSAIKLMSSIVEYAKTQTPNVIPTNGWSTTFPSVVDHGDIIWSRTITRYSDETSTTAYAAAYNGRDLGLEEANAYTDQKIRELINDSPATLDTLKEIADAIGNGQVVLYGSAQTLTDAQKIQAQTNIGVKAEIDNLKNSVSDGKSKVANAITGKGISTATNATFQTMANNINSITTGSELTNDATAVAEDIISGKTAYARNSKLTGTMVDHVGNGDGWYPANSMFADPNGNTHFYLQSGAYRKKFSDSDARFGVYSPSGPIRAALNTEATATAHDIIAGQKAWVGNTKVTGTLPNHPGDGNGYYYAGTECWCDQWSSVIIAPYGAYRTKIAGTEKIGIYCPIDNMRAATNTGATATAHDILSGKTAWVGNVLITGTGGGGEVHGSTIQVTNPDKTYINIYALALLRMENGNWVPKQTGGRFNADGICYFPGVQEAGDYLVGFYNLSDGSYVDGRTLSISYEDIVMKYWKYISLNVDIVVYRHGYSETGCGPNEGGWGPWREYDGVVWSQQGSSVYTLGNTSFVDASYINNVYITCALWNNSNKIIAEDTPFTCYIGDVDVSIRRSCKIGVCFNGGLYLKIFDSNGAVRITRAFVDTYNGVSMTWFNVYQIILKG